MLDGTAEGEEKDTSRGDEEAVMSEEKMDEELERLVEEKVRKRVKQELKSNGSRRDRKDAKEEEEMSRRSFLKKLGLGAAGVGAFAAAPASAINFKSDKLQFYGGSGSPLDFEVDNSGNVYAQGALYANGNNQVYTTGNDGPLLRSFNLNLSSHKLNAGEFTAMHRFTVPSGRNLEVFSAAVSNNNYNQPSGLNLVVRNVTAGTNTRTYSTAYSDGNPLDSFAVGGDDILIGVDNGHHTGGTGSMQVVNAHIKLRVE